MSPGPEIRSLRREDVDAVGRVHRKAFPESALSRLGRIAVRRYYEWQLGGPHEYEALGAFVDDELVGYCFGGISRGALSGYLQRNRTLLATSVAVRPWLLLKSEFRQRLREGVQVLAAQNGHARTGRNHRGSYGILAVAVVPDLQREGIGRLLMETSESEARKRGFKRMHLTVHPDDRESISFYERLGWTRRMPWAGRMEKHLR